MFDLELDDVSGDREQTVRIFIHFRYLVYDQFIHVMSSAVVDDCS